jgi:hypothetical protein
MPAGGSHQLRHVVPAGSILARLGNSQRYTTMESEQGGALPPQLAQAQETLKQMLEEACAAEIYSADTGQLIRIEEVLALADEAAKEVISIRRKRRHGSGRASATASDAPSDRTAIPGADLAPPDTHRIFQDAQGVQWDACAIRPSAPVGRVQLPEPYRSGWIFFESVTEKRRLSPIPDDWPSISDDVLREMCTRADVVPERAPSARRRRPE